MRTVRPVNQKEVERAANKERGGFYTPPVLASWCVSWAVEAGARVLEPSAGDGVFVSIASEKTGANGNVVAIELDGEEAEKVRALRLDNVEIQTGDAFSWYRPEDMDGAFDAVVGNPPFVRYQSFPEAHREPAFAMMRDEGLHPSRLTNAWVPFVVLATRALREDGRLAMVIPAELLQVSYAAELRSYLTRNFRELTVVAFRDLVFKGIQQETILLLGVRSAGSSASIRFIETQDIASLTHLVEDVEPVPVDLDHATEKWTQYLLTGSEIGLLRSLALAKQFVRLGDLAEVDVGVVTGRNEFFVMTPSEARDADLIDRCLPMVGRSAQIPGLRLRREDWTELFESDTRCLMLQLGKTAREDLSPAELAHVLQGEAVRFHDGYKCRIRLPTWWNVPGTWVPDGFLLRQIHDGPRLIANAAGVTATDTIHRVRTRPGVDVDALASMSMNSLTWAFSEVLGRSYGGGVLELEPTEAEALPFPNLASSSLSLDEIDDYARRKPVSQVLDEVDRLILRGSGLTDQEIKSLRGIWSRLSSRRMNRKGR